MEKNEKLINTYTDLIKYFSNVTKKSDDKLLIECSKNFVVDFVNKLCKLEQKEKEVYEKMLEEIEIDKSKLIYDFNKELEDNNIKQDSDPLKKEDEKQSPNPSDEENKENDLPKDDSSIEDEMGKYVEEKVYKTELRLKIKRLEQIIEEDLKNPNDVLIETWIKNYKDFVVENDLEEKYMIQYMKNIFKIYDTDKKYIDKIEEIYKNIDIKKDDKKTDSKTNDSNEKVEDIGNLKEDGKKTDDSNKKDEELEEEKENDNKDNSEKLSEENLENKPIKIVSTKKTTYSKAEKIGLGVLSIACLSTPFITPAVIIAFMTHRLYKNHKYKNSKLMDFLTENGFNISKENELIDEETEKPITEETIGKVQYQEVKKELLRMGALESKFISEEYKKNKFLSVLMGLNPVKRLKDIKKNIEAKKEAIKNATTYLEEQTIKKGMRGL